MIKVSVMYPNSTNTSFDIEYYCNTHMPMVEGLLGEAIKGSNVDSGMAGGTPGEIAPFIAMGHMIFDSIDSAQKAFGPNAKKIMADIPNYTNAKPKIQISKIKG